jgi:hypothetical protein
MPWPVLQGSCLASWLLLFGLAGGPTATAMPDPVPHLVGVYDGDGDGHGDS